MDTKSRNPDGSCRLAEDEAIFDGWFQDARQRLLESIVSWCVSFHVERHVWVYIPLTNGYIIGTDACVVPALSPTEASSLTTSSLPMPHPHLARTSPQSLQSFPQTSTAMKKSLYLSPGRHTDDVLRELGVSEEERKRLIEDGALGATVEAKL